VASPRRASTAACATHRSRMDTDTTDHSKSKRTHRNHNSEASTCCRRCDSCRTHALPQHPPRTTRPRLRSAPVVISHTKYLSLISYISLLLAAACVQLLKQACRDHPAQRLYSASAVSALCDRSHKVLGSILCLFMRFLFETRAMIVADG